MSTSMLVGNDDSSNAGRSRVFCTDVELKIYHYVCFND